MERGGTSYRPILVIAADDKWIPVEVCPCQKHDPVRLSSLTFYWTRLALGFQASFCYGCLSFLLKPPSLSLWDTWHLTHYSSVFHKLGPLDPKWCTFFILIILIIFILIQSIISGQINWEAFLKTFSPVPLDNIFPSLMPKTFLNITPDNYMKRVHWPHTIRFSSSRNKMVTNEKHFKKPASECSWKQAVPLIFHPYISPCFPSTRVSIQPAAVMWGQFSC